MATTDTAEHALDGITLRNEPVQARSTARLATLLDAAAVIIDEIGYERLTTAMVAERAGASIGTVYRYFPDRIALLQALGARNLERMLSRIGKEMIAAHHADWTSALNAAFGILEDAYRNEPGFRGLRVGDVIDLLPPENASTFNSIVAERLLLGLVDRFGFENNADNRFLFETAIEVSDALAARAFARNLDGDRAFLDAARDLVRSMLAARFGDPALDA